MPKDTKDVPILAPEVDDGVRMSCAAAVSAGSRIITLEVLPDGRVHISGHVPEMDHLARFLRETADKVDSGELQTLTFPKKN